MKKLVFAIEFFTTKRVITAASALTYSTILSFVPICAVVFAIARGFGFTKYIEEWFRNLLSSQPQAAELLIGFVNSYLGYFLPFSNSHHHNVRYITLCHKNGISKWLG